MNLSPSGIDGSHLNLLLRVLFSYYYSGCLIICLDLVLVLIVLVEAQGHLFRVNSVNEFKMKPGRAEIQREREPVQSFTNDSVHMHN